MNLTAQLHSTCPLRIPVNVASHSSRKPTTDFDSKSARNSSPFRHAGVSQTRPKRPVVSRVSFAPLAAARTNLDPDK